MRIIKVILNLFIFGISFSGCVSYSSHLGLKEDIKNEVGIVLSSTHNKDGGLGYQRNIVVRIEDMSSGHTYVAMGLMCHASSGGPLAKLIGFLKNQIEEENQCGNLTVNKIPPGKYQITSVEMNIMNGHGQVGRKIKYKVTNKQVFNFEAEKVYYLGRVNATTKRHGRMVTGKLEIKDYMEYDKQLLDSIYEKLKNRKLQKIIIKIK